MKQLKNLLLLGLIISVQQAHAQFGYVKKAGIDKFKDSRLVVVLFADSAYNASIQYAVEKYWNFTGGFVFVSDTALKPYSKGDYSFLVFSKSKPTKLKAKLCTSEEDFNGLVITSKFKKRIPVAERIAGAYSSNTIDTADWLPELIRGVQLLNNFFTIAIEAQSDREVAGWYLQNYYPNDKGQMSGRELLIEAKNLELKGKEDGPTLFDGEIDEIPNNEDINNAIVNQASDKLIYYFSKSEKKCAKLLVTADGHLMYFKEESAEKCKCTASDLKNIKKLKDKSGSKGD